MGSIRGVATPPGFTVRPAAWDDLAGVVEMFRRADTEDWGEVDMTETALREEWENPNLDLSHDTWIVREGRADGSDDAVPVAYAYLDHVDRHRQLETWGVVHPSHRGRGLGSFLLDLVEARAQEHVALAPPDGEVALRLGVIGPDEPAHRLVEARGFRSVRHFWRMDGKLAEGLAGPADIPGIRLRPFVSGEDDRAVHAAHQESFAENWGFVKRGFNEWAEQRLRGTAFNPDLWFVATEEDEIAGFLMSAEDEGSIWVATLGVRPAWRRRGIGESLLRYAFLEFWRRGFEEVGLSVDSSNETGATALYERVGMRLTRQYDMYEKRLR